MALFSWTASRPSMETHRLEWEVSWERDFKRNYEPIDRLPESGCLSLILPPQFVLPLMSSDSHIMRIDHETKVLMQLQRILSNAAIQTLADFEARWRALSDQARRERILDGICCFMRSGMEVETETDRRMCPESSLEHLASAGGETFLTVLRSLLIPPEAIATNEFTPAIPSHPAIDRVLTLSESERETLGYRRFAHKFRIDRAVLLTEIIRNTYMLFVSLFLSFTALFFIFYIYF
jgi:hypothetical protein